MIYKKWSYSKGTSLIELLLSLSILASLALGFKALSSFLDLKRDMVKMSTINQSQHEIENIVREACPFVGKKPGDDILKIEVQEGGLAQALYVSSKDPDFNLAKDKLLGEQVFIKEMVLKKPNDLFVLEIKYIYGEDSEGEDLIETKEIHFKADFDKDDDDRITGCASKICKKKIVVVEEDHFGSDNDNCKNFIRNTTTQWMANNPGKTIEEHFKDDDNSTLPDGVPFYFYVPKKREGKSQRIAVDNIGGKCMCLGIFTCYQNLWSQSIKCFEYERP